jgi:hypothetical protein
MQYKTVPFLYREEDDKWRSRIKYESGRRGKNKREEAESSKEGVM